MGTKEFIQKIVPKIDSPEKVYELLRGLGYPEDKDKELKNLEKKLKLKVEKELIAQAW